MSRYRDYLTKRKLMNTFPTDVHETPRPNQEQAFGIIADHGPSVTLEAPTGTGKTLIGTTVLSRLRDEGVEGQLVYITPNKAQVDQVAKAMPGLTTAYGRADYPCVYFPAEEGEDQSSADDIPCITLTECPHRVNLETGKTKEPGVEPCPYYLAKYRALNSDVTVVTMAWYLFNTLFRRDFQKPAGLVIDEVHRIADIFRASLSYDISDAHLRRSRDLLRDAGFHVEADALQSFLDMMWDIHKRRTKDPLDRLLKDEELEHLVATLDKVDPDNISKAIQTAREKGEINLRRHDDRKMVRQLEKITMHFRRYVRNLRYAMSESDEGYKAVNYVYFAAVEAEKDDEHRTSLKLVIKSYRVAPVIKKLLSPCTISYSATIGNPDVFTMETGIDSTFFALDSTFDASRTRILLPVDAPDLSQRKRSKQEPTKSLRRIARACARFNAQGHRCLVVTVSNQELDKFLVMCSEEEENLDVVSYRTCSSFRATGEQVCHPKEAVEAFKNGEGMILAGTAANFGEGIDLPEQMAPVTFMLRPGYPSPKDPQAQFEKKRFGGASWSIWNWRVALQALQVRGRNVRSATDYGATIFVSSQFKKVLWPSLPEWLRPAYKRGLKWDECLDEVDKLLAQ